MGILSVLTSLFILYLYHMDIIVLFHALVYLGYTFGAYTLIYSVLISHGYFCTSSSLLNCRPLPVTRIYGSPYLQITFSQKN